VSSLTIWVCSEKKFRKKNEGIQIDCKTNWYNYKHKDWLKNLCRAWCSKGRKSNIARCKCNPSRKTDPMDSPSSSINHCSIFINWTHKRLKKTRKKKWLWTNNK
jgi:hypothetical protein